MGRSRLRASRSASMTFLWFIISALLNSLPYWSEPVGPAWMTVLEKVSEKVSKTGIRRATAGAPARTIVVSLPGQRHGVPAADRGVGVRPQAGAVAGQLYPNPGRSDVRPWDTRWPDSSRSDGRVRWASGQLLRALGISVSLRALRRRRAVGRGSADVDEPPGHGQEFARVVEDDDAVAQQAPPLPGVEGDGAGRVTVSSLPAAPAGHSPSRSAALHRSSSTTSHGPAVPSSQAANRAATDSASPP